jgi:hypothetical protein
VDHEASPHQDRIRLSKGALVNEESVLLVVPRLSLDGDSRTVGDLVFTTRQVFLAKTAGNADARAFGIIEAAAAQRSRNSSQQLQARPLEAILAMADPSTRFEYRELQSITVKLGGLFSSPAVRLIPYHGRRLKLSGKRSTLVHLATAVPLLARVGAPISLS